MNRQLTFDLPVRAALGRDDFFVSPANAAAVAAIDGWQDWPLGKLILSGPEGAGKTHLAHVWAAQTSAQVLPATALAKADLPALAAHPALAVEDVPQIAGTPGETALFHLHNMMYEARGRLLLTGRDTPARWPLKLPDLASRMAGTALAQIAAPDDELLARLLCKHFADRQLTPPPAVIQYIAGRIERSFAVASQVVAALDAASLSVGRKITVPLAAKVLESAATDTR